MHINDNYDLPQSGTRIESLARTNELLKRTYALLAAVFAAFGLSIFLTVQFAMPYAMILVPRGTVGGLVYLGSFFLLCYIIEKNRHNGLGLAMLFVLVTLLGASVSPFLMMVSAQKGPGLIINAAVMTVSVFAVMSLVAFKTNFKSTALDNFMAVGSIVVLVSILASLFTDLSVVSIALSGLFIVFFSMLIMYQTKRLVEGREDSAVSIVLTLFLSIYNIFLSIVNILYRS